MGDGEGLSPLVDATLKDMSDFIANNEMHQMLNRIGSWLVKNSKVVTVDSAYHSIDGREADLATIQNALYNYKDLFSDDNLTSQYALIASVYKSDNLPNYVTLQDGTRINRDVYIDMATRFYNYTEEHGREPNIVYFNSPNNTSGCGNPYTQKGMLTGTGCSGMGQCTGYYCACNSVQQAIYKLTGKLVPESDLASAMGTTTNGTGHSGIETGLAWFNRKYGYNLKISWKNFSELGSSRAAKFKALGELMCQSDKAVFCHLLYRNQWGHYEVPLKVDVNKETLQILNSLGSKCNNPAYCGYIEERSYSTQESYIKGISQKSIAIISR